MTLDMVMPVMSGLTATEYIMAYYADADPHRVRFYEPGRTIQDLRCTRSRCDRCAGKARY
jgi:CheY-like chemotaxis protein